MSPVQPILIAAALYNLALVIIILTRTRENQGGRNFAWYILGTAGWTACIAAMQPQYGETVTLWLVRGTFFCATVFSIAWVWFCADFPTPSPKFRKLAIWLTVVGVPWFALSWLDGKFGLCSKVILHSDWVQADIPPLVAPFTVWLSVCGVAGLAHLAIKGYRARGFERLQIRYILLGGVGLLVAGSIPDLILPLVMKTTQYSFYGPLATLFITTTTTYAIVRYRLMDIKIVLRAGMVFTFTIVVLALLFTLVFKVILGDIFHLDARFGGFLSALLLALAFQPIHRYVSYQVDMRFFKSVYDYKLALSQASNALASVRDRELLAETLENALIRTMKPRGVAVYLPGHDDILTLMSTQAIWEALPHTLPEPDPVLYYALDTDDVMVMEELMRQAEPARGIGERLRSWEVHVAFPLIAGGRLSGIVFLGEKLSGDIYNAEDIGLMHILGKQAATALDNARHYHEMVLLNDYHARLLHVMQDGVVVVDPEQCIATFNPVAEKITGVPAIEAMGKRLEEIGLTLPVVDTDEQGVETSLTNRDGDEIPVLVTVTPFTRRWETEHSHLVVFRDLSTLRALEQEKMQAERYSMMGFMAGSLAHEIKNPLVPIQLLAHMLPLKYDDAEFRKEFSETVVKEVGRISQLITQMLDLVRKPSTDREVVDVHEVIEQILLLTQSEFERQRVEVQIDNRAPQWRVVGVRAQLYQAVLNVVMNSLQVMPDGGTLHITLRCQDKRLVCCIRDSGPGVSAEDLRRIFEPLYTTKVSGNGMGLAFTYHFVRAHGGEVRAECPSSGGLLVSIVLPAYQQREAELLCSS